MFKLSKLKSYSPKFYEIFNGLIIFNFLLNNLKVNYVKKCKKMIDEKTKLQSLKCYIF